MGVCKWTNIRERIREGYYGFFDAGTAESPTWVTPYRKVRYHLTDWINHTAETPQALRPQNKRELFNLRHSSKRTRVEITIGLLKGRCRLLVVGIMGKRSVIEATIKACVSLHNLIQTVHGKEDRITKYAKKVACEKISFYKVEGPPVGDGDEDDADDADDAVNERRDTLASLMWENYLQVLRQRQVITDAEKILLEEKRAADDCIECKPAKEYYCH